MSDDDPSAVLVESSVTEPDVEWSAPSRSPSWTERHEPWSVLALVTAVLGLVPLTWPVPILSFLAVAFAVVGLRECQRDRSKPNRWMAVTALAVGLLTLAAVIVLTGLKDVALLPFWTDQ